MDSRGAAMSEIINAWSGGLASINYIERLPDGSRKLKTRAASYSMFLDTTGISHDRLIEITRIPGIRTVSIGGHLRIDAEPVRSGRGRPEMPFRLRERIRDELRAEFGPESIREADVDPVRRWIADDIGVTIPHDPTICYLDLEVQSPGMTIDDSREGRSRILSFAALGSDQRSLAEVMLPDDPRDGNTIPEHELDVAERALVTNLIRFMRGYDCIVAWYGGDVRPGTGFDFDALRNRSETLGISPEQIFARRGMPRKELGWESWIWLDQLEVYKKYAPPDKTWTLKLGGVATIQGIEDGKLDFDASQVWNVWASGPEGRTTVLEYNIRDTALLPQIEAKCNLLALHFNTCALCHQIPHTRALRATQQADGYLIRYAGSRGYRWATNWWDDEIPDDEVEGAYVFPVKRPGLHEHVNVGDFRGLYPSIMRTWNIGPDTVSSHPSEFPDGTTYCKAPLIEGYFRTDKDSFFRQALSDLITNRARYKGELKNHVPGSSEYAHFNNLSQAAKIVANSFYGVLLCKHYRYFDAVAGHAVTSTGQWLIQTVAESLEGCNRGWEVIGGDTDSVFVWTVDDCITPLGSDELYTRTGHQFIDEIKTINGRWPGLVTELGCEESFITLDWEQSFKRAAFLKKKMYFGTSHFMDGKRPEKPWKHKYRGIAVRRGDKVGLAKEMMVELLAKLIGTESDPVLPEVPSTRSLSSWVADWRARVITGSLAETDVVMVQSIRKPIREYFAGAAYGGERCKTCRHHFGGKTGDGIPTCPRCGLDRSRVTPGPHVRIAQQMVDRGETPMVGDKIRYVYTWQPEINRLKWVPSEVTEISLTQLDRAQYWFSAWSPSHSVLVVTHPDGDWIKPDKERSTLYKEARAEYACQTAASDGLFGMLTDPGSFFKK
jgi:DNA polymerase elongation subunit (family B)